MAKKNGNRKDQRFQNDRKDDRKDEFKQDRRTRNPHSFARTFSADSIPDWKQDMEWYDQNPALTQSVARVPFPYRPGMDLPSTTAAGANVGPQTIPGVLRIEWVPSVGYAASPTDPINIAGKEVYGVVREAFSGSIDADAPDFMIYFACLADVFNYIGELKRIYRLLNHFERDNFLFPTTVLRALGLPSEAVITALQKDRTRLWGVINQLVGMTKKLRCPNVFPLFKRRYWMSDQVYGDSPSMNSQMYVFMQKAFFKFSLQKTPAGVDAGGAQLQATPVTSLTTTDPVGTLFDFGRALIDALAESDDAYIISGYLMRAYGDTEEFVVDELPENEQFVPYYAEAVLRQIHNVTVASVSTTDYATMVISQDPTTNCVLFTPASATSAPANITGYYIDSRMDIPDVEEVVECTRMKAAKAYTAVGGKYAITAGTEIPTAMVLFTSPTTSVNVFSIVGFTSAITLEAYLPTIAALAKFDWAPDLAFVSGDAGEFHLSEWHNTTHVSPDQLQQINRVCLLSEFNAFRA